MSKTFYATIGVMVEVDDDARVAQVREDVARAVENYLTAHLTTNTTAGGYRFKLPFTVTAEIV